MLAFLRRRYLSHQPRHDKFVYGLAFGVAVSGGVYPAQTDTCPSHAYLLQETQALFSNANPFEAKLCFGTSKTAQPRIAATIPACHSTTSPPPPLLNKGEGLLCSIDQ